VNASPANRGLGSYRLLIADDDIYMCRILRMIVANFGMRDVHVAENGAEALDAVASLRPDVLIVDWDMPIMNGIDLTQLIRRPDFVTPFVPIVLVTGYPKSDVVRAARDAGADEIACKPISQRALADRLNAALFAQRPFVSTSSFFGPDRRRRSDPLFGGRDRRTRKGRLGTVDAELGAEVVCS